MVYYTYVTYQSTGDSNQGEYFNWVMVTPDRNTANTYFRALQQFQTVTESDVNGTLGLKRTFTSMDRYGPQFWTYDSDSGENFHLAARALCGNPKMKQVNPDFVSVFGKIRVYWIGAYAGGRFRTFFPQDDGASGADEQDLLSGYSFFVKRRDFSDYWHLVSSGDVIISNSRRSRFIFTILLKSSQKRYPKMPITDADEIKIEVLERGIRIPVRIANDNQLVAGTGMRHQKFTFRDLRTHFSLSRGTIKYPDGNKDNASIVTWVNTESEGSPDAFDIIDGTELDQTES